jgi:hypothetical protein
MTDSASVSNNPAPKRKFNVIYHKKDKLANFLIKDFAGFKNRCRLTQFSGRKNGIRIVIYLRCIILEPE